MVRHALFADIHFSWVSRKSSLCASRHRSARFAYLISRTKVTTINPTILTSISILCLKLFTNLTSQFNFYPFSPIHKHILLKIAQKLWQTFKLPFLSDLLTSFPALCQQMYCKAKPTFFIGFSVTTFLAWKFEKCYFSEFGF
jgi:hypothetical protein